MEPIHIAMSSSVGTVSLDILSVSIGGWLLS